MKESNARYQRVWKVLCKCAHRVLEHMFHFEHGNYAPEGPCLIVSNHVTNWDPLLLAICFPKRNIHFVASEHIFRMGWKSKAISYLVAPIPRRKGANGAATAMDCLRKMRAGSTVCIFAEGETTWNGKSNKVFPATGTLARASGATLVTFRFEGGYLTAPRWGDSLRRGRMRGHIVNTYSPEQLKAMKPQEIEDLMNADIFEDAWARQKAEPVKYKGKQRAKHIETALFMCPKCHRIDTITGAGNELSCSCGMKTAVTEYGTFDPPVPFENMAQWDEWQHEMLDKDSFEHGEVLFEDGDMALAVFSAEGEEKPVLTGTLSVTEDALTVGSRSFPLKEISDMAAIQRRKLAFMFGGEYYELSAPKPICLRKYLPVWKNALERAKAN